MWRSSFMYTLYAQSHSSKYEIIQKTVCTPTEIY